MTQIEIKCKSDKWHSENDSNSKDFKSLISTLLNDFETNSNMTYFPKYITKDKLQGTTKIYQYDFLKTYY